MKTEKLINLTLPQINDELLKGNKAVYLSVRYFGTKITVITDSVGNIKKMKYKGSEITEITRILNKNVDYLVSFIERNTSVKLYRNETFFLILGLNGKIYSTLCNITDTIFLDVYRVEIPEPFKSKKVAMNFARLQIMKKYIENDYNEILIEKRHYDGKKVVKKKFSIVINPNNEEFETIDSSYAFYAKKLLLVIENNLAVDHWRLQSEEKEKANRIIEYAKTLALDITDYITYDDNLLQTPFKIFNNTINLNKIPNIIKDEKKILFFCFILNMFGMNSSLKIKNEFITEEDRNRYHKISLFMK